LFLNDIKYNWIGDIPKDWEVKRIKNLFYLKKEVSENPEQEQVLSLTMNGIIKRDVSSNEGQLPDTYKGYTKIYPDDIVMNPMDLKSGWIDRSKYDGIISPSYYVLNKLNDDLEIQFFNYQLQRHYKERIFFSFGQGVSYDYRWGLGRETILNFPIVVPPKETQTQIVSFLDTKTQKIDELIQKTEQKIKLLKEKRTSLINHCVTKGLNPDVEMKDSGVEWIGEIPSEWGKSKVKYLTDEHRQGYYSSEQYSETGLKVVRITDLNDDRTISIDKSPHYNLEDIEKDRFILKNGDFLFPRTGGVGRFGIFNDTTPSIYGSFLIRFRFNKKIFLQFLRYYFDSEIYLNQILSEIHGGVNQNVHVENIKDCFIYVPGKLEQTQIVEYLDEQTQKIDSTIEKETQRIELLKEYRQSLISEVVTGKIDVRDWNK